MLFGSPFGCQVNPPKPEDFIFLVAWRVLASTYARYDEDNESDGRRGHARTQGGTIVKGKMQREVGRPPCFGIDDGEGGDITNE